MFATMPFSLLRIGVRAARYDKGVLSIIGLNGVENCQLQAPSSQACLTRSVATQDFSLLLTSDKTALSRHFSKHAESKTRKDYDSDSDSDSDDERTERGTTEFWRRKIRSFHGVIDVNKDGVVSYDDFKIIADRFIRLGHLDAKQRKDFLEALRHVWEEQWGIVDKYNMVTTQQYLENMHHVLNDKSLKRKTHKFLPYLFQAVDHDKSGSISVAEFKLFFKCLGLNQDDAAHSFQAIDSNKDGIISLKEFVKYGRDYFLTEDESRPSKMFWGPLASP